MFEKLRKCLVSVSLFTLFIGIAMIVAYPVSHFNSQILRASERHEWLAEASEWGVMIALASGVLLTFFMKQSSDEEAAEIFS